MPTLSDEVRASYYDWAHRGSVFVAYSVVTAPVIWSTAAGTGGPLLWNNTAVSDKQVNAVLLGLGVGITTASGAASALGITGGPSTVPTSLTTVTAVKNCLIGGPAPRCNVYNVGTPSAAGTFFVPTHAIGTGALNLAALGLTWVDLGGSIIVPSGNFASVAASATATSAVLDVALMWAEIPV